MYIIFGVVSLIMGVSGALLIIVSLMWQTWAQIPIGMLFVFLSILGFVLADIRMMLIQQKIQRRINSDKS